MLSRDRQQIGVRYQQIPQGMREKYHHHAALELRGNPLPPPPTWPAQTDMLLQRLVMVEVQWELDRKFVRVSVRLFASGLPGCHGMVSVVSSSFG